jgi:hypothetical protein
MLKESATGIKVSTHTAIYTLLIQKCMHKCTHARMHAGKQAVWSSHVCIYTSTEEKLLTDHKELLCEGVG